MPVPPGPYARRGRSGRRGFRPPAAAGEEVGQREDRGADRDGVGAEAPEVHGDVLGGIAQGVRRGVPADGGQEAGAELEAGPAADEDAFGLEEVDQVGEAGAQVLGGLLQDGECDAVGLGALGRVGGGEHRGERGLLVRALRGPPALLAPAVQQRFGARVRLQAAEGAAAAAAAPDPDGQMPPLDGPAVLDVLGDERGAHAGAEEHDHRVAGAASGAEPHLGLAQGPGAVVREVRDGVGEFTGGAEQGLQRDGVPADGLAVHDRATLGRAGDDAGHPYADAEELFGGDVRLGQDLGDAVADVADDDVDVVLLAPERPVGLVALALQRAFGAGEFGQGQVEQLDTDAGFADVDADHVAASGHHAQQGAGPAAVGVDASGLLDEAVGDEFGDHVADGSGTQPGRRAELVAAHRPVEIQPL